VSMTSETTSSAEFSVQFSQGALSMSHETTIQPSRNGQQAADVIKTPDPEWDC
jgi:hypothetical protein